MGRAGEVEDRHLPPTAELHRHEVRLGAARLGVEVGDVRPRLPRRPHREEARRRRLGVRHVHHDGRRTDGHPTAPADLEVDGPTRSERCGRAGGGAEAGAGVEDAHRVEGHEQRTVRARGGRSDPPRRAHEQGTRNDPYRGCHGHPGDPPHRTRARQSRPSPPPFGAGAQPARPQRRPRGRSSRSGRDERWWRDERQQRSLGPLQLLVAAAQLAGRVALLGDVAAEQLAGADVDRVVGEEPVEDVGLVAGVEPVEAEQLELLEVGALRTGDLEPALGAGVVPVEHAVARAR